MKEWQKLKIANLVRVGKSGLAQFTTIQAAINYAAAQVPAPSATNPWTVEIYPGIYDEAVTLSSYVNLVGIGTRGSVVVYRNNANIFTLASNVQVESLTVRNGTPTLDRRMFSDQGSNTTGVRLLNLIFEVTTPGAAGGFIVACNATSNILLERCSATIGGTGAFYGVWTNSNAVFTLIQNDLTLNNVNGIFIYCVSSASYSRGNTYSGTGRFTGGSSGTIYSSLDSIMSTGAISNFSGLGILRLKNSYYKIFNRFGGSGNIVDESPYPLSSIYHVIKKLWEVAVIANMNIATRTAVGGTATVGGAGQAVLRINDLALDAAGVESAADAAGSLASTFTPAKTPRYVQQISVNAFRATTTMFFGLRGVLGAAVPAAAEHHAGFIWNGANFIASSSNGGGVGGTTNLTTPTVGVPVQLEVIILGGVQVEFYIDGVLVATHTTAAKIPTAVLYFQEYEISTGAGGATTSDITLREGFIQECPA